MALFFIDRPIFAWVISLLILLAGILAIQKLPIAQYPDIAPPVVNISATYPGASAKVMEDSVTALIDREMNGAPGLMYVSASSSSGYATINLTFKQGVNIDLAAVEVQNRLKAVEPRLPEAVRQYGIVVEKAGENIQAVVSLSSTDPSIDEVKLGEIASTNVTQVLKRVPGVGKVTVWGAEHAMRIWPDPQKLTALNLTTADIASKVRSYNSRVVVGELGNLNVPNSAPISANIVSDKQLTTPEEFGNIPLRTAADGSAIRLKDVARVELGANDYSFTSRVDGKPATALGIKLSPSANAVAVVKEIRRVMDKQAKLFPAGVAYQLPYETSSFVEISIQKVIMTLLEAIALVFVVMYLFMQNFRATLIPTLVVPIALAGTFAVMQVLGYSINVLSMFGMVLAIGILVDDAIVVVENVERIITEEGKTPYEATVKAMSQISGAIVGITVVLITVFIPMAFFSGAVGNIYRQFSVALAVSIAFSAFLALSLTPALCVTLLKPIANHGERKGFFGWFNRKVNTITTRFHGSVGKILHRPLRWMLVYAAIVAVVAFLFLRLPTAFLPAEDQGNFMVMVTEPQGATMVETQATLKQVDLYLREHEPVAHAFALGGFNFFGSGPSMGMIFVTLKPWAERGASDQHVQAVVDRVNAKFAGRADHSVYAMNSPALPELGNASGFDLRFQDRSGAGYPAMVAARDQLLKLASEDPHLKNVMFAGSADTPQINLTIDRDKAEMLGVSVDATNSTLATMFGSDYVGDFMLGNQTRKVMIQADGKNRVSIEDIGNLRVKNERGEMVALSAFTTAEWRVGPPQLDRYNGYPSFSINGEAAAGASSGAAMLSMERLMDKLPAGFDFDWTGQSFEERLSGSQAPMLYALTILIVFLALAALYESWSIPVSVLLVVPLGVIGAVLATSLRGMPNDIYFKVGLITTVGLSAKNAILIVEVAKDLYYEGMDLLDATLEAARLRLRPIVMTSLAFGIGVIPLVLASGASSGAQTAIGTAVLGGIITATLLAIFLVPLFFFLIGRFLKRPALLEASIDP